jgi:acyl-CoA reductase-like NAD-dependent aldehyde dehydrogenase
MRKIASPHRQNNMSQVHQIRNPWSGNKDFRFTEVSAPEVQIICNRLKARQPAWSACELHTRLEHLRALADSLRAEQQEIVAALVEDTGRERIAHLEFELLIQTIERVVAEAPELLLEHAPALTRVAPIQASQQRVPYGLMLNIAPWNFPLLLSFLDVFPALAMGNAAIIKPSEITPRWIAPVLKAIAAVPEISAVLEILPGSGALGAHLMEYADVVSFTGSVRTGRFVNEAAARLFIPAYLELGGKDPAIVLASADLEYAANTILFSAMSASGQACQSLELALVDASLFDEFIARVVDLAQQMTINHPDRAEGFVGPFIMEAQAAIVKEQLRDAVAGGARVLCGGNIIDHGGLWLEPTVLVDVQPNMKIVREETFGPVLPVLAFATPDDAIELANASSYGLSASVFAGDVDEARSVARQLNAGAVNINDASLTSRVHDTAHESFGLSGLGRSRFGAEGYLRYARCKAIFENNSGTSVVAG